MSGIVVDHKEAGVRYAISENNFNAELHVKVRDLRPGESVRSFRPKPIGALVPEGGEVEYYDNWKLAELQDEIASRNEGREEEDLITPVSGLKVDLASALMTDDEATAESAVGDDKSPNSIK